MIWLAACLGAAALFSANNLVDAHVVTNRLGIMSKRTLTALAGLAGLPLACVFVATGALIDGRPDPVGVVAGIASSGLITLGLFGYTAALRVGYVATVGALFQLIVPMNYLLGLLILDERPDLIAVLGAFVITAGAILLTVEHRSTGINSALLAWMVLVCVSMSASDVIFKEGANDTTLIATLSGEYLGMVLWGTAFLLASSVRRDLSILWSRRRWLWRVTQSNEGLNLVGQLLSRYAFSVAPIVLVQGVLAVQPLFLLFLAVVLARIRPHLAGSVEDSLAPRQRLIGTFLLSAGVATVLFRTAA